MDDTNTLRTAAQAVVDACSCAVDWPDDIKPAINALAEALAQPEPAPTPAAQTQPALTDRLGNVVAERLQYIREQGQALLAWQAADFPCDDPHDTYPDDLWSAAVRPETLLPLLDALAPCGPETAASAGVAPPVALPAVVDAEARDLHLDIVEQGFTTLIDSLMPSFEYVGVALRVSAEDHAAIRSAMAGARTSMRLLKNARAALATHPAPASASEPDDKPDPERRKIERDAENWRTLMVALGVHKRVELTCECITAPRVLIPRYAYEVTVGPVTARGRASPSAGLKSALESANECD